MYKTVRSFFCLVLLVFLVLPASDAQAGKKGKRPELVKIWAVASAADPLVPWQRLDTEKSSGSGVIIDGQRILTNAHVVADAVVIEVKREGMTRRYEASVEHVGHECDLAILTVESKDFFTGATAASLGTLPEVGQKVRVYGFPIGGETISMTSGIVSRVEVSEYAHSEDELLLVQIDAAINSGNSGGPVFSDDKLVGIAAYTADDAENIGYIIPPPVIEHFLADVADGDFGGFPTMDFDLQAIANPALRRSLKLAEDETGGLITRMNHGGSGHAELLPGDVLLSVDGQTVAEDLSIDFGEHGRVSVSYAFQRRQVGKKMSVEISRGGVHKKISVTLRNTPPLIPGPQYDHPLEYLIFGGLVFQPVTWDYINFLDDFAMWEPLAHYGYTQNYRSVGREELIVVSQVLASPMNRGYHDFENVIVKSVQGVMPRSMEHLRDIVGSASGTELEVLGDAGERIVLDLALARKQSASIKKRYRISSD